MSFNITMEFLGLSEVQREIEKLSTESELKALNKKIVKRAGEIGLQEAEGQIRKKAYSKNPMKSGRKGSRTGQHAADNVPKAASTQSGNYGEVIGWDRGDVSPFFYMKFHEWGTTEHPAKGFMLAASRPTYEALKEIAEEEYEKTLKEKLGVIMAGLSEVEIEALDKVIADYPNNEELDLTAFIAEVIGITGVHVEEGWYNQDINETHITFYFMNDEDADYSEDTNESEEYYIQVDIWSKEDCFKLKKKVKKLLKKAGFTYFAGNDQYETDTMIYHKAARFYFSMNVEGVN